MKHHENKIEAVRNMMKSLHKDLRINFGHNIHIDAAVKSIMDEILILEQRISQAGKDA